MIEQLHTAKEEKRIVLNPVYLTDDNLPEAERRAILDEVFNRNIREKQVGAVASHLSPVLSGAPPQSLLVYGPTGSGKTVTLIHVLSAFQKVAERHGVQFRYVYVDLTHPKTLFGAFNEVAMALDGAGRRYRKGMPIDYMQGLIMEAIGGYDGFLCLLIDEVDNISPHPDEFLMFLSKTLPRKVPCRLVLAMLANRLDWEKALDPRIVSCLKKNDLIIYRRLCQDDDTRPLTQRRFSDMISFLDLYGLVNARMVTKGRYGNTREISSSLPAAVVARVLPARAGWNPSPSARPPWSHDPPSGNLD